MRFNINIEDIKYLKVLYKDINNNRCTIKAAIKNINEREILACAKFENELFLQAPQDVMLSFVCSDGLYRTKAKLKSVEEAEPYIFFYIETPEAIEYEQNREFFRVPVQYDCVYSVKNKNDYDQYSAKTVDISANGVSICLPEHLISQEDSLLEISIAGTNIHTKVRYIRSEKTENGYRLSFTYTQITNQDRDLISRACIQKQLEQKRKYMS